MFGFRGVIAVVLLLDIALNVLLVLFLHNFLYLLIALSIVM